VLADGCLCPITYDSETGRPLRGNATIPSGTELLFRFNAALSQARKQFHIPYGEALAISIENPDELNEEDRQFEFSGIFPEFEFVYQFDGLSGVTP